MPYRRQDSTVWWVSFTAPNGKRVRRSTETENRKEAEALEAKWKLESYRTAQWNEQPSRTFEELMLAYLTATTGERRSEDTVRLHVKRLKEFFAGQVMNSLRVTHVSEYVVQRKKTGVTNATVNRELEVLCAAINYANREWEWNLPNPAAGRKLKEPQGRLRWITRAEADNLLRAARDVVRAPHLAPLLRLALHTGMRRGEMLGLAWRRVDLKANLVHLGSEDTKTGKRRSVPLNSIAREAIIEQARFRAQHCPDSPWVFCNRNGRRIADAKKSFATACRRAGIEDFHFHDLRHTCAAWLVSAGVPLAEVRDLLGHSTIKMTERYAHLAPDNVRDAVAVLEDPRSRFGHVRVPVDSRYNS